MKTQYIYQNNRLIILIIALFLLGLFSIGIFLFANYSSYYLSFLNESSPVFISFMIWAKYFILNSTIYSLIFFGDMRFIPIKYNINDDYFEFKYLNPFLPNKIVLTKEIKKIYYSKRESELDNHKMIILYSNGFILFTIIPHSVVWKMYEFVPYSTLYPIDHITFMEILNKSKNDHNEMIIEGKGTNQRLYGPPLLLCVILTMFIIPTITTSIEIYFPSLNTILIIGVYIIFLITTIFYIIYHLKPKIMI